MGILKGTVMHEQMPIISYGGGAGGGGRRGGGGVPPSFRSADFSERTGNMTAEGRGRLAEIVGREAERSGGKDVIVTGPLGSRTISWEGGRDVAAVAAIALRENGLRLVGRPGGRMGANDRGQDGVGLGESQRASLSWVRARGGRPHGIRIGPVSGASMPGE